MVTLVNQYSSLFTHADHLQLSSLSVENTQLTGTQIRVYLLAAGRAQIKVNYTYAFPLAEFTTLQKTGIEKPAEHPVHLHPFSMEAKYSYRCGFGRNRPLVAVNSDVD